MLAQSSFDTPILLGFSLVSHFRNTSVQPLSDVESDVLPIAVEADVVLAIRAILVRLEVESHQINKYIIQRPMVNHHF